jgi:MerR family transcriptional regulator, heat shock protein HspR
VTGSSPDGRDAPQRAASSRLEGLDDRDAAVYSIGVVAETLGVSVQVVRRYDAAELVQPQRSPGGQRRYSRRDVELLAHVVALAEEQIPLRGIRRILELEQQLEEARAEPRRRAP